MFKWRREMGIDPWTAKTVPQAVINQDLIFIDLEEKVRNRKSIEE